MSLSLNDSVSVLQINKQNYALILPNRIVFAVDASEDEIAALVQEERSNLEGENLTEDHSLLSSNHGASLTLLPTLDCNLRCVYCYARGGDDKIYMSKEVAKAAIDAVSATSSEGRLTLHFAGGGEPFANFEVMDFATRYAQRCFDEVAVAVVTNGTFNDEQLEWILDNRVSVRISCDGAAHEYQRPFADGRSSKNTVERNIRNLVRSGREFMVQCIVTSQSVGSMVESAAYFGNLGVKTLKVEPAHMSETCRGGKELTPLPKNFADSFVTMLKYIVDNALPLKIDTSYLSRPTTGYYCGVCGENLIVTPEGNVTACVEIIKHSEPFSDVMLYGRLLIDQAQFVFSDVARAKLRMLHFSNYRACCKCPLRLVCKGGCPMQNIWENGFSLERSKYTCQVTKLIVPEIFSLMIEDARYNDVVLDDFQIQCAEGRHPQNARGGKQLMSDERR